MESPRLWSWERRLKLMMIVTLVYALLLELLRLPRQWLDEVLRQWLPPHRKAEPGNPGSALQTAHCSQSYLSTSIPLTSWTTKVRDDSCFAFGEPRFYVSTTKVTTPANPPLTLPIIAAVRSRSPTR